MEPEDVKLRGRVTLSLTSVSGDVLREESRGGVLQMTPSDVLSFTRFARSSSVSCFPDSVLIVDYLYLDYL